MQDGHAHAMFRSFPKGFTRCSVMQALLLTLGRMAALLEGDATFSQMAIPLLMDGLAVGAPVQLRTCTVHVLAAVAGFAGRGGCL